MQAWPSPRPAPPRAEGMSARLLRRSPLYLAALLPVGFGLLFGQPGLLLIGLAFLVTLAAPDLWYALAFRRLTIEWRLSEQQVFLGETLALDLTVTNRKWLPLPWIELRSDTPTALEPIAGTGLIEPTERLGWLTLVDLIALWRRQRVTLRHTLFCSARGVYQLGAMTVRGSDPFGWFTRVSRLTPPLPPILVYPLVAPLDDLSIQAIQPFGELVTTRRLLDDPLRVAGVRDYQPGDDPRLIHWKATARAGALHSKVLDPAGQYRFLLLLDVNADAELRRAFDVELLEYGITVVASLATWALDNGYPTGLLVNSPVLTPEEERQAQPVMAVAPGSLPPPMSGATGAPPGYSGSAPPGEPEQTTLWLPPDGRPSQRERILGALARLRPQFGLPIEGLADAYRSSFGAGTTMLLVTATPALRPQTVEYLSELRRHGMDTHIVLIGYRGSAAPTPTFDVPTHRAGGKEVWRELLSAAHDRFTRGTAGAPQTRIRLD